MGRNVEPCIQSFSQSIHQPVLTTHYVKHSRTLLSHGTSTVCFIKWVYESSLTMVLSSASAKTERENNRPWHREPLEGSRDQVLIGLVSIFIGQGYIGGKIKQAFSEK